MNCPSCQNEMGTLRVGELDLCNCESCLSVWFSQGQLTQLDWADAALAKFIAEDSELEIDAETCPRCELALHKHKYPTALQVECFECYQCSGIYLTSSMIREVRDNSMSEKQREAYLNNLAHEVPGFLEAETTMNHREGASGFAQQWLEFKSKFRKK